MSSNEVFLDEELRQALKFRLSKVLEDEEDYIWYTNWVIVSKEKNCIVGGKYQAKGYMTETVRLMKDWLLSQSNVKYVIADTDKNNIASHKVLRKAGATLYSESNELYFWRFV